MIRFFLKSETVSICVQSCSFFQQYNDRLLWQSYIYSYVRHEIDIRKLVYLCMLQVQSMCVKERCVLGLIQRANTYSDESIQNAVKVCMSSQRLKADDLWQFEIVSLEVLILALAEWSGWGIYYYYGERTTPHCIITTMKSAQLLTRLLLWRTNNSSLYYNFLLCFDYLGEHTTPQLIANTMESAWFPAIKCYVKLYLGWKKSQFHSFHFIDCIFPLKDVPLC